MTAVDPEHIVEAVLDRPIPMQGLHGQCLGVVTRCRLSLNGGQLAGLKLQTQWQTIELDCGAVTYDERIGAYRLLRQNE